MAKKQARETVKTTWTWATYDVWEEIADKYNRTQGGIYLLMKYRHDEIELNISM